jgi:EmrB/QacA subfamily drug resistance transporter
MPDSPAPPTEREQLRYAWRALSVVGLASILTALGSSSLNVALPDVVRHFHAGAAAADWMLLSFMLANTVLMVVFGRLADLFGRRALYLWGLATYTGTSMLLGFAPGAWWVVGLRVVQAAGGAMLLTNSAALLTDAFPRRHLGRGMGIYIASFSVAQLVGPTLGGFLTHRFGWQWVFWFNVPVGVLALLWGAVVLRRTGGTGRQRGIDLPGNLLVLASLGGLLFGLTQVGERGWSDPVVLVGLGLFAALLPVFAVVERRTAHPVVDVRLFADRTFGFGLLAAFLNAVARMAVLLLVALFYQAVHGQDPVSAGVRVLPGPVAAMTASACSGPLAARLGARRVAALGSAAATLGLVLLLLFLTPGSGYPPVGLALVVLGAGSGLFMPANTTGMLDGLPPDRVGIVNAMRLMVQNTGVVVSNALALSLVTSLLPVALRAQVFAGTLSRLSPAAVGRLTDGYRLTLGVLTAIAVLGLLACLPDRAGAGAPAAVSPPSAGAAAPRPPAPAPGSAAMGRGRGTPRARRRPGTPRR